MNRSLIVASLGAVLLLGPALSSAQPPPPNRPNPNRQPNPRREMGGQMTPRGDEQAPMQRRKMAQEALGLTDAQKDDMRKATESALRDRLRKSTDLKIAFMDLQSLLRAEKVDEKGVAAKLSEIQVAQGALLKIKVDSALAMKRILTPEQQKKVKAMGMRGANRMNGRRGGMQMRGPIGKGPGFMGQGRGPRPGIGDFDLESDLDLDLDLDLVLLDLDDDQDRDDDRDHLKVIR